MKEDQKDFLLLLSYLFLKNGKNEKANTLLCALHGIDPEDSRVTLSYCYSSLLSGDYEKALELANVLLGEGNINRYKRLGLFMKSKALWGLGKEEESQYAMNRFLRFKEDV